MSVLQGIDVSYAQGDIDWPKVADDVDFAFIKATEGRDFIDERFSKARVTAAEKAFNLRVGYYHFAHPDTASNQDARQECRDFVGAVRDRGGRIGRNGVLDYELAHHSGDDQRWIAAWVDEYRKLTDSRPWIYGGSVLREKGIDSNFGCPLWLAAYVDDPKVYVPGPWRNAKGPRMRIWQYTDHGTCPGIAGYVDRNRFYGDAADLRRALS